MANTELDQLLLEYLREQRAARDAGCTPRAIMDTLRLVSDRQLEHEKADEVRFAELRGDLKGTSLRLAALEKDIEDVREDVEDTGEHHVERLERELDQVRAAANDSRTWWSRHGITVLTSVIVSAITGAAAFLAQRFGH